MIASFACKQTHRLYLDEPVKRWSDPVRRQGRRKLMMLDAVAELEDLRSPPGNRLEALKGHRRGQYSIRINQQWRLCFRWSESGAHDVEIVDYH